VPRILHDLLRIAKQPSRNVQVITASENDVQCMLNCIFFYVFSGHCLKRGISYRR
jgi:hypothetical protein